MPLARLEAWVRIPVRQPYFLIFISLFLAVPAFFIFLFLFLAVPAFFVFYFYFWQCLHFLFFYFYFWQCLHFLFFYFFIGEFAKAVKILANREFWQTRKIEIYHTRGISDEAFVRLFQWYIQA